MKKTPWLLVILALVVFPACREKPPKVSCLYGESIPALDLDAITQLSTDMMTLLLQKKYKEIQALGTEEMQNYQSADRFAYFTDTFLSGFGDLDFPKLEEAYYLTGESKEEQVAIPCNLGMQGAADIYHMPSNRELAVTVFTASTHGDDRDPESGGERMRIVFQLEKEDGVWRLRSMNLFPSTIKHKLDRYFYQEAEKFRKENLLHLAYLYYKTAILLTEMGMNVEEAVAAVVYQQLSQIKVDYMPEGDVQTWSIPGGPTYKVYNLDTAYDRGALMVHLSFMTDSLKDEAKLKSDAGDLAVFLDGKFPEYRKGFDGVRVTAVPENRAEAMTAWHRSMTWAEIDALKAAAPKTEPTKAEPPREPEPPVEPSPGATPAAP